MNARLSRTGDIDCDLRGRAGISLVEVLVALILLSVVLSGLAMTGAMAATDLRSGKNRLRAWAAAQQQMEVLTGQDIGTVTAGSATVDGYPMTWSVTGTDPRTVALVVEWQGAFGTPTRDTVVSVLTSWR